MTPFRFLLLYDSSKNDLGLLEKFTLPGSDVVNCNIMSKDPKNLDFKKLESSQWKKVVKTQGKPSIPVQQVSDAKSSHDESISHKIGPLKVGMVVKLLNIAKPRKVVAEGTIVFMDPKKELDGVRLGDGFWIVRIDKVLNARENLLISHGDIRKLGQASNKNLFWRVPDIEVKKN